MLHFLSHFSFPRSFLSRSAAFRNYDDGRQMINELESDAAFECDGAFGEGEYLPASMELKTSAGK